MFIPPFYWLLSCVADSFYYMLRNIQTLPKIMSKIEAGRKAAPEIIFYIRCYHERTETTKDMDGNESSRTVEVDTHVARQPFIFSNFIDNSPAASSIDYLQILKVARLLTDT